MDDFQNVIKLYPIGNTDDVFHSLSVGSFEFVDSGKNLLSFVEPRFHLGGPKLSRF